MGYLLTALMEIGPAKANPHSGQTMPLDWVDINAGNNCLQWLSEPWEFRTLQRLSHSYCVGVRDGEVPRNSIPPLERETDA